MASSDEVDEIIRSGPLIRKREDSGARATVEGECVASTTALPCFETMTSVKMSMNCLVIAG
jgi:hypothetical protein